MEVSTSMGRPTQGAGIAVRGPEEVKGHCSKWRLECRQWIAHHLGLRHSSYIATASCPVLSPFGSTRQLHRLLLASWALPRSPSGCSVNPFPEGVRWLGRPLPEPPSIPPRLSRRGVNGCRHSAPAPKHRILSTYVPKSQKPCCQDAPRLCRNGLPKPINCAWVDGRYVVNSVTSGAPWGRAPRTMGCSCFTCCCTKGLAAKRGPAVS